MTTDPTAPTGPSGPRQPDSEANGMEAGRPLSGAVKCVGFCRMGCPNMTDTILCSRCWDLVDKSQEYERRRAIPMRLSPRPHNGVEVRTA